MNCTQYHRRLSDGTTNRLTAREQDEMAAHVAVCPACAREGQAEAALVAAWRGFPAAPSPDVSPRLMARINAVSPTKKARNSGYFGYLTAAGAAVCALGLLVWTQKSATVTPDAVLPRSVALAPPNRLPLAEMLTEVRWRSSGEGKVSGEPPSYNEETRALLLPETGNKP